jgi:hypothetical protein
MKTRISISIDQELLFRCKADAEELRRNLSSYISVVLEQRHGLMTVNLPPPVVTKLPMHAKRFHANPKDTGLTDKQYIDLFGP